MRTILRCLIIAFWPIVSFAHPYRNDIPSAPHGARFLNPIMGGRPVSCVDGWGRAVWVFSDHLLPDVGNAAVGQAYIRMNPHVLIQLPPSLQLFWYGHECAHHVLRSANETAADCWSITTGARHGWFTASDIDTMAIYMQNNPGDWTHAPGSVRVANMAACYKQAIARDSGKTSVRQGRKSPKRGPLSPKVSGVITLDRAVTAALDATRDKFAGIRGEFDGELDDDDKTSTYKTSFRIDGIGIGMIFVPANGKDAFVTFDLYEGEDQDQARTVYRQTKDSLDDALPSSWSRSERETGRRIATTQWKVTPNDRRGTVRVRMNAFSSGRSTVTLFIDAP